MHDNINKADGKSITSYSVFMIYTSIYTILFLQEMPEDCAKKAISGDTLVLDYEVQLFIL